MSSQFLIQEITPEDIGDAIDIISEHVLDGRAESRRPTIQRAADTNDPNAGGIILTAGGKKVGCMIYTLHSGDETLSEHFSRPIPHTVSTEFAILRYAYLRKESIGNGYGTEMTSHVISTLKENTSAEEVYVEAWHRPEMLDMRPLLDKFGFDSIFVSDDYWAHPDYDGRTMICVDCGSSYVYCGCGGGIYRLQLSD